MTVPLPQGWGRGGVHSGTDIRSGLSGAFREQSLWWRLETPPCRAQSASPAGERCLGSARGISAVEKLKAFHLTDSVLMKAQRALPALFLCCSIAFLHISVLLHS